MGPDDDNHSTNERSTAVAWVNRLDDTSLWWWGLGIGGYGVGDTLTTIVGVWAGHGVEAGPVVSAVLSSHGFAGLLVVKTAVLLGFYLVWRRFPPPGRVGIPLALSIVGVVVTVWNVIVMLRSIT